MGNLSSKYRTLYVINDTRKEIQPLQIRFLDGSYGLVRNFLILFVVLKDVVRKGWNIHTVNGWSPEDSVVSMIDEDCALPSYVEDGYTVKPAL